MSLQGQQGRLASQANLTGVAAFNGAGEGYRTMRVAMLATNKGGAHTLQGRLAAAAALFEQEREVLDSLRHASIASRAELTTPSASALTAVQALLLHLDLDEAVVLPSSQVADLQAATHSALTDQALEAAVDQPGMRNVALVDCRLAMALAGFEGNMRTLARTLSPALMRAVRESVDERGFLIVPTLADVGAVSTATEQLRLGRSIAEQCGLSAKAARLLAPALAPLVHALSLRTHEAVKPGAQAILAAYVSETAAKLGDDDATSSGASADGKPGGGSSSCAGKRGGCKVEVPALHSTRFPSVAKAMSAPKAKVPVATRAAFSSQLLATAALFLRTQRSPSFPIIIQAVLAHLSSIGADLREEVTAAVAELGGSSDFFYAVVPAKVEQNAATKDAGTSGKKPAKTVAGTFAKKLKKRLPIVVLSEDADAVRNDVGPALQDAGNALTAPGRELRTAGARGRGRGAGRSHDKGTPTPAKDAQGRLQPLDAGRLPRDQRGSGRAPRQDPARGQGHASDGRQDQGVHHRFVRAPRSQLSRQKVRAPPVTRSRSAAPPTLAARAAPPIHAARGAQPSSAGPP